MVLKSASGQYAGACALAGGNRRWGNLGVGSACTLVVMLCAGCFEFNVGGTSEADTGLGSGQTLPGAFVVSGVMVEGELLERLSAAQARDLIDTGVVNGGMMPKVRSALAALEEGVPAARIIDLAGLHNGGGTTLVA